MDIITILKIHLQKSRCSYSFRLFSLCNIIINNSGAYRGEGCIKTFCESLREQAMEIINFKKKKNEVRDHCHCSWKYRSVAHKACI